MSCLKFKLYQTQKNTVSFGILCAKNFSSDTSQKVSKSDGSLPPQLNTKYLIAKITS